MSIEKRLKLRVHAIKELSSGIIISAADCAQRTDFYSSCLSCIKFDEKTELCGLNNLRPPAIIIANGCECYDDSGEIPF